MEISRLERDCEIADAELAVAEELVPFLALAVAGFVKLLWDNWFLAILSFAVTFYTVGRPYRKKAAQVEDLYHRTAGMGKHAKRRTPSDSDATE